MKMLAKGLLGFVLLPVMFAWMFTVLLRVLLALPWIMWAEVRDDRELDALLDRFIEWPLN